MFERRYEAVNVKIIAGCASTAMNKLTGLFCWLGVSHISHGLNVCTVACAVNDSPTLAHFFQKGSTFNLLSGGHVHSICQNIYSHIALNETLYLCEW